MKDTSRSKNAEGEAGNTGEVKKTGGNTNEIDATNAINRLNNLSGTSFDKAYVEMMVTDHQNAVALFKKAAHSTDSAVKAYASKYLPTLRKHLEEINALADKSSK
jgi:putative membrane protein